ncbi:MAG TPA: hypothetical protein PLV68_02400 [Ilumatobacteraceae bacterium]|nr:hypothetical protein [Ilumatobacteraceae bacterium]
MSAAMVDRARAANGWQLPVEIASLVDEAYGALPAVPDAWRSRADAARGDADTATSESRGKAQPFRLLRQGDSTAPTLAGLHASANQYLDVDRHVCVRDSDGESVEVILLRRDDRGYWSLRGDFLGVNGETAREEPSAALGGMVRVRIPSGGRRDGNFLRALDSVSAPPAEWSSHPWLRHWRVLCLDDQGTAQFGQWRLHYDATFGLSDAERSSCALLLG